MDNKEKKRIVLIVILFVIFILLCYGVVSLLNELFVQNGGEEIGQYYNVDNSDDILTLEQYMKFTLIIDDTTFSGTYQTYECCDADYYVILYLDDGNHIVSSYSYDGTIVMSYNSRTLNFAGITE